MLLLLKVEVFEANYRLSFVRQRSPGLLLLYVLRLLMQRIPLKKREVGFKAQVGTAAYTGAIVCRKGLAVTATVREGL